MSGAPRTCMERMAWAAASSVVRRRVAKAWGRRVWSMMPTEPSGSAQTLRMAFPWTFMGSPVPGVGRPFHHAWGRGWGGRIRAVRTSGRSVAPVHEVGEGQLLGGDAEVGARVDEALPRGGAGALRGVHPVHEAPAHAIHRPVVHPATP